MSILRNPYLYTPPKRRRWPLVVAFAVGWVCALVLPGSQHREAETESRSISQVKPKIGASIRASDLVVAPGREVQAPVDASSASNNAEDTLPTKTPVSIELERADAEAKMPSEQPSSAPSATFHVATAAPARARIRAARPIARPRFAFARLQTKITSHRREVSRNRMAEVHEIAPNGFRVPVYRYNSTYARYGSFGSVVSPRYAGAN